MNVILFFTLLLTSSLYADEINWAKQDFPPAYLKNSKGYIDQYISIVHQDLVGYQHKSLYANFARTLESMKNGKKVCSLAMLKNDERAKYAHYSIPYMLIPANSLIMLVGKATAGLVNKSGVINLEKYLSSNKKLGVATGRSYGARVDKILSNPTDNIINRGGQNVFEGLFGMLARGRLDAILGYRMELHWFSKSTGLKFISYPIEGENEYIFAHAACPKNEWGESVIQKINKTLKKLRVDPNFYGIYFSYLPFLKLEDYELEIKKHFKD